MEKRSFKNEVYGELAKITKALANPHRMEIIDLLAQSPFSVENIAKNTGLTMANASQHLQVLKQAKLLKSNQQGNSIYYQLQNERVFKVWREIRELGIFSNGEMEKLIRDQQSSKGISFDELAQKLISDEIILLDVRPEEEYQRGHIHRAISIPLEKLLQKLETLPKNKEIIAYCRGPFCLFADEAVEILQQKGFTASRLQEGYPDWKLKEQEPKQN